LKEGILPETTNAVRQALDNPDTDHIIWSAKDIVLDPAGTFCSVYSHELAHFEQETAPQEYKTSRRFLENRYQTEPSSDLVNVNIFHEVHADTKAKSVVEALYGSTEAQRYIDDILMNLRSSDYIRRMDLHNSTYLNRTK
jgi:hypothetical protein